MIKNELTAQKRETLGSAVNKIREQGFIPAELYGHNAKNIHLSLPKKEFFEVFKITGGNEIINLSIDDKKIPVLIHEVQKNSLSSEFIHVDLYQVKMTEKIIVNVPVEFIGEAPAVKEKDGVLVKTMQEIKVEALPANLPHSIKIDLTKLDEIGKNIHVNDLEIPEGVKVIAEPEAVVATVTEKVKEEEIVPEVKIEEIVTEGEEKKAQAAKEETEKDATTEEKEKK